MSIRVGLRGMARSAVYRAVYDAYRKSHEIEGSSAGAQTDYQVRVRALYDGLDITAVDLTRYGTVIAKSAPVETDDLAVATGAIIEKDGTLYHIYGGAENQTPEGPNEYKPHLATSTDGITLTKQGKLFDCPAGHDMAYPSHLFLEGGTYYLFFHVKVIGEGPDSATGWAIWYATSANLTNWTVVGKVVDNQDLGWGKAATNPSVIKVEAYYYMVVSEKIGAGVFYIHMLKSSSLTSGYADLGVIIDPTDPQYAWYGTGAWDASVFEYNGQYVIVFGASDGTQKYYAFAYATDIEAVADDWTVIDPPFLTHAAGIGGRSTVYFDGDILKIYCDLDYAGDHQIDLWYDSLDPDIVSLGGNCRTDFADVRFRQGVTELDYWIEKKVDSNYAIFWVEVPTIPADPDSATIYIYYGRAGVTTTTSSIYDTFPVGDDFEECDLARWSDDDVGVGVSACQSDQKFEGTYSYRGYDGAAAGGLAILSQVITERTKLKVWGALRNQALVPAEELNCMVILYNNGTIRLRWRLWDGTLQYRDDSGWVNVFVGAVETWYQFLLIYKDTVATIYFFDAEGNSVGPRTDIATMDSTGSINKLVLQMFVTTGGAGYSWQDIIRLGEYCDPEPTHGAWGSEEAVVWPF